VRSHHRGCTFARKLDGDDRTAGCRACDGDPAAVRLDDALGRRQTQTRSTRLRREEWHKDSFQGFRGDARALIGHRNLTGVSFRGNGHPNRAAPLHRMGRSDEEIHKRNLQEFSIRQDSRRSPFNADPHILERRVARDVMRRLALLNIRVLTELT
jgi:hypothetical protein